MYCIPMGYGKYGFIYETSLDIICLNYYCRKYKADIERFIKSLIDKDIRDTNYDKSRNRETEMKDVRTRVSISKSYS